MGETELINIFMALIPALIVALLAAYFFQGFFKNEEKRRLYLARRDKSSEALPLRLQAYERMTLFLERMAPGKLLFRVQPVSESVSEYATLLIATIDQEFEHNISQQIYLTNDCWDVIKTAKNVVITSIRKGNLNEEITSIAKFREFVLTDLSEKESAPIETALTFIRREVKSLI